MNLPDAPIAQEGFFATHFFTVRDQEQSKDFYLRILGGTMIKPEIPCYIELATSVFSAEAMKIPKTAVTVQRSEVTSF